MTLPDNRLREPLSALCDRVPGAWGAVVQDWRHSPVGRALIDFVESRQAQGATLYPREPLRALAATPLERVRVVILGQDPYHGPGQAEGLAFSVPAGLRMPPSLRNIFKEQARDLGLAVPAHGHLGAWAAQGVLLLNTVLTVEDGLPASHARKGWEALTDSILIAAADDTSPKVFMLWGAHAQAKAPLIAGRCRAHAVFQSNHPSPLSALRPPLPFIGNGHFGAANRFLQAAGAAAVDWGLPAFEAVI